MDHRVDVLLARSGSLWIGFSPGLGGSTTHKGLSIRRHAFTPAQPMSWSWIQSSYNSSWKNAIRTPSRPVLMTVQSHWRRLPGLREAGLTTKEPLQWIPTSSFGNGIKSYSRIRDVVEFSDLVIIIIAVLIVAVIFFSITILDLRQCFDPVPRQYLWSSLQSDRAFSTSSGLRLLP